MKPIVNLFIYLFMNIVLWIAVFFIVGLISDFVKIESYSTTQLILSGFLLIVFCWYAYNLTRKTIRLARFYFEQRKHIV